MFSWMNKILMWVEEVKSISSMAKTKLIFKKANKYCTAFNKVNMKAFVEQLIVSTSHNI